MHTLVIKGNVADAFKALDARKIEATSIVKHERWEQTFVTTLAEVDTEVLAKWFNEDIAIDGILPAGSLLWYAPIKEDAQ